MPALMAILVVLALAPSSFAQISITLTPNPSPGEIQTNHNAQTAIPNDGSGTGTGAGILVTGALLANSPLTTTVLRLAYPSTITSSPSAGTGASNCTDGANYFTCLPSGVDAADPIRIEGQTGVFAAVTQAVLNTASKRVEITLPGFPSGNTNSGSFRVVGVRQDMNGATAPVNVTASLSNPASNYLLSTTSATVVNASGPGIGTMVIGARSGSPSASNVGTATIFTNRTVTRSFATLLINEGMVAGWRSRTQLSNSGSPVPNRTRIQLTFNNVPTGVTLTLSINFPSSATGNQRAGFVVTGTTTSPNATITSTSNVATVEFTGSVSQSALEGLEVDTTAISLTSTAAVTTPGTITVTSTMAPVCTTSLNSIGLEDETVTGGAFPCFTEADVGPVTIVNIVPVSTTMLMPYAITLAPFDTGLAVANTTADPFGSSGGGATPTTGTLTLNFYPTASTGGAGTPFSLTTSSTVKPGVGLSSDGTLAAGATWTVLLSQLLAAASITGNFQGYIFMTANFLDAHGTATISDFRTYSLTSNVLVLPPPAQTSRNGPTGGAEQLNH